MEINIGWLYANLMNIYGDYGNILTLKKRCEWRGIEVNIIVIGLDEKIPSNIDLLFMGGGQDRQQTICAEDLINYKKDDLFKLINRNVPALFVCGAYQLMGSFYHPLTEDEIKTFDSKTFGADFHQTETKLGEYAAKKGADLAGIGLFKVYTVHFGQYQKRCIGNVFARLTPNMRVNLERSRLKNYTDTVVGFENHGGRTYPLQGWNENLYPLARILNGYGNNGDDKTEGAIYKNAIGTYLHGPLLPKNPHLADYLLTQTLINKYQFYDLRPLSDEFESDAHQKALAKKS